MKGVGGQEILLQGGYIVTQSRAECIVMMLTHKMQQSNALQVMCRKEAGDGSRHQAKVLGLGVA